MYKIGDYVMHKVEGICIIDDTITMQSGGEQKKYFKLIPVRNSQSIVYVPVDFKNNRIRPIISDTFEKMAAVIEEYEVWWINDHKLRNHRFQEMMRSGDFYETARLLKVLLSRDECQPLMNKDRDTMLAVKRLIVSELAIRENQSKDRIEQNILYQLYDSIVAPAAASPSY